MRPEERAAARRQLDRRLTTIQNEPGLGRPTRGWIKASREALGMTTAQLGRRMGVSQPRVVAIEKAEVRGAITLETLERAFHALDCRLVYAPAPRTSLDSQTRARAAAIAGRRLHATRQSMALEDQSVDDSDEHEQLELMIRRELDKPGSTLWDDL